MSHATYLALREWLDWRFPVQNEMRDRAIAALRDPQEQVSVVVGRVQLDLAPAAAARIRLRLLQELLWEIEQEQANG